MVDAAGHASVRLQNAAQGGAWAIRVAPARVLLEGQALQVDRVQVTRITDPALHHFELSTWCGTGPRFEVSFDGGMSSPVDVYEAADQALPCP